MGTTTERNTLTPSEGTVFLNTTTMRFERYTSGAWRPQQGNAQFYTTKVVDVGAGAYNLQNSDFVVLIKNAAATLPNINMPAGIDGKMFYLKVSDNSNNLKLQAQGTDIFNGAAGVQTFIGTGSYQAVKVIFKSGSWWVPSLWEGIF